MRVRYNKVKRNMQMRYFYLSLCLLMSCFSASAQAWLDADGPSKSDLGDGLSYRVESQMSVSDGRTPLWLNANRYGLSSLDEMNGYLRGSLIRPLQTDSARRWGVGYGLDVAVASHYTSEIVVQQAFGEVRWLRGALSVGAQERPMELKPQGLSSGSQTLGINARPVPQVRLALVDYWPLPYTNGWFSVKGHIAYGMNTDDSWQKEFTNKVSRYTEHQLYHSKAGYLKIGNEERFFPLSLELGLEMAAQFGGKTFFPEADGTVSEMKGNNGFSGFWHAFWPGGADAGETTYQNAEGNHLGSWLFRLNYDADTWRMSVYGDKYFEDHSAMLGMDYDGYETGENWQQKKKHRYLVYDLKDMMLGMELTFKYSRLIRSAVLEYIYTKYQSGPIYHDHTQTVSDHIGGRDNYYNHNFNTGWQHWGQVMGNPLYLSPLYNADGQVVVENNRFVAIHGGISGEPSDGWWYRMLATWQEGIGTYDVPYLKSRHNFSLMLESGIRFKHGWQVKGAFGMDAGSLLGHNYGGQITLSKAGLIKQKK